MSRSIATLRHLGTTTRWFDWYSFIIMHKWMCAKMVYTPNKLTITINVPYFTMFPIKEYTLLNTDHYTPNRLTHYNVPY